MCEKVRQAETDKEREIKEECVRESEAGRDR